MNAGTVNKDLQRIRARESLNIKMTSVSGNRSIYPEDNNDVPGR